MEWRKNGQSWNARECGRSHSVYVIQSEGNSELVVASYEKYGREPISNNVAVSLDVLTALLAENGYILQKSP